MKVILLLVLCAQQSESALPRLTSTPSSFLKSAISGRYSRLAPFERLATTPLYFLSTSEGYPYPQTPDSPEEMSSRMIIYYMSSEDANSCLRDALASDGTGDYTIGVTTMENVMSSIQSKKQSCKINKHPTDTIYKIQPSCRQCKNAISRGVSNKWSGWAPTFWYQKKPTKIPLFTVPGLEVKQSNGERIQPFYVAHEDLIEDLRDLFPGSRHMKTQVVDLANVLKQANTEYCSHPGPGLADRIKGLWGKNPSNATSLIVGIVPPRSEIEVTRNRYRGLNAFVQRRLSMSR